MFEKNIQIAKDSLIREINFRDKFIYLDEILANPAIDEAYKNFFRAEVAWWIYEKQTERKNSVHFDYSNSELKDIINRLDNIYFKTARFDSATLFNIIETAVKVRANMVCRPRNTLRWFVFRLETTKPFTEIIMRMNYLGDYSYLREGFERELRESGRINDGNNIVNVEYFTSIIEKLDDNNIYSIKPEEFSELIEPVFSFFNPDSDYDESRVVPVESLVIYLDDKNIFPLAERLEALYKEGSVTTVTKKYITEFIYNQLEMLELEIKQTPSPTPTEPEVVSTFIDSDEPGFDSILEPANDLGELEFDPDELIMNAQSETVTEHASVEENIDNAEFALDMFLTSEAVGLIEHEEDFLNEKETDIFEIAINTETEIPVQLDEEEPGEMIISTDIIEDINFDYIDVAVSEPEEFDGEELLLQTEIADENSTIEIAQSTSGGITESDELIVTPEKIEELAAQFGSIIIDDYDKSGIILSASEEEILNIDVDELIVEEDNIIPELQQKIEASDFGDEPGLMLADDGEDLPFNDILSSLVEDKEIDETGNILQDIDFESILDINSIQGKVKSDSDNKKKLDDEAAIEISGRIINIMEQFDGKNSEYKEAFLSELEQYLKNDIQEANSEDENIISNDNSSEPDNEIEDLLVSLNVPGTDTPETSNPLKDISGNPDDLMDNNGYTPGDNGGDIYFIDNDISPEILNINPENKEK